MKKKICMIVPSFSAKGGITAVVNGYKHSKLEDIYDISYIETYCDGTKIKKLIKALKAYFLFKKEIKNNRPDIVHVHSSFGASFYRKMFFINYATKHNIPVVNHVHGSEVDKLYTNTSQLNKRIVRRLFDKCSIIIMLSEESKKAFSVIDTKTRITVLNNFGQLRQPYCDKKNKVILFLGFITQLKGCFDLPDIIRKVVSVDSDVHFIIGGDGETSLLHQTIEKMGLTDKVIFPGWVTGRVKDQFLRESSLFLLPSYTEGMPMSILEAMGYSLPIISTKVGGVPQLVKHGENGYLYKPGDIDGISSGIIKVLSDNDLQRSMGMCSYNIVKNKYSLEKHVNELLKIYNSIMI